jgi:hypothetical protein
MTGDGITEETRAAIRAHAAKLVEAAPRPTDEQIAFLRRFFGPDVRRPAQRDVA